MLLKCFCFFQTLYFGLLFKKRLSYRLSIFLKIISQISPRFLTTMFSGFLGSISVSTVFGNVLNSFPTGVILTHTWFWEWFIYTMYFVVEELYSRSAPEVFLFLSNIIICAPIYKRLIYGFMIFLKTISPDFSTVLTIMFNGFLSTSFRLAIKENIALAS